MAKLTYDLTVKFRPDRGYIAHPYWPEQLQRINILKESGANRARSAANRRKALEEYLQSNNMTLLQFEELERLAERPFYTNEDGMIVIPINHVEGFLVATCDTMRAAQRPCPPDQVRSRMTATCWETEKDKADGTWIRFVTATGGAGNKLSNQRMERKNEYISDFTATGTISFDDSYVKPSVLQNAIQWGGANVGIGASRKMGYGRFDLVSWKASK